ncbi:Disease resistance protein [Quillaja saponaria]|uniref:Disease resistance protein n=1 Tax=Quillaja saponaria TaxID=32244 RepID=A0AAD7P5X3_QUISA|nr:Disease resistance protein [Quillaja saponaria]
MCGLKVMDLTGMCFSHLPSSITLLTNLQTLCLDHCVLEDIAVVGELKNLKVLSLVSSDIKQLPHAIGQLTQLQLLDLQNCSKLEFIPPNIITSSKQLEVLKMSNNCCWWEAEIANSKGINASITELNCLPRLNTLEIWIRDPSVVMLTDLLFIKYLERYKILMGDVWNWSDEYKTSRTLKLKLNMSLSLVQGIKKLLERVEDLHLDELSNVKNVIYELNGEGFPSLKHLLIQNNDKIEYIVNSMDQQLFHPGDAFPILESLIIHDLIKLEKICIGQLSVKSFGKLQVIKVKSCHKLKNLFAFSTVSCFSRLLEIEVSKCNFMQEIVISGREESSIDNTDSQKMEFHQLHSLTLRNLPSLIGFHHDDKTFHTANEYDTYMTLFCEKALFPNLETLVISYMDNLKTIWSVEDVSPNSFGKLKSLNIKCSQKLLTIVPSNMLRKLQNLETLTVGDCSSLNDIFRIDARDESEIHGKVDIRLKNLSLEKLSELKHIWNKDPQGVFNYQMLKAVQVIGCDQFRNIFPASIVKCQELQSPGLKRLDVANCQKLELRGTESSNSRDTDRQDVEIKQPLTIVEKVMPNLEFLALGSKDTIWLLNGQSFSPASNFRKLEHLAFPSFPNEHELAYGSLKERVPCGRPMTIQEQHIMGKNTIYN